MFNRKADDKISYAELQNYARNYVKRDDVEIYRDDLSRALAALDGRVSELENIARTLRSAQSADTQARAVEERANVAMRADARTGATAPLTKRDAEVALADLRRDGEAQFRALHERIASAVTRLGAGQTVAASDLPRRTPGASLTVDYGAIAYGLSELKSRLTDDYPAVVQYFADVFAKADPSFDMDAFERQAGVVPGDGEDRASARP